MTRHVLILKSTIDLWAQKFSQMVLRLTAPCVDIDGLSLFFSPNVAQKKECVKLWISALTITVFDVTHLLILSACRMPTGPSGDICVTQAGRKKRMWCACACVCLCVFVYDREIIPVHVLIECFLFKAS